jgi:galactose mutarotase-like enzyme
VPDNEPWPPSGEQVDLRYGDQTAVVVTVGGGLRSYRAGDHDVLDGFAADAIADGARGQTLIPWPNRVRDGKWEWQREPRQLAITEPAQHNAIHGLVRWLGWSVAERRGDGVTLRCASWPQPGYPWPLEVSVRYDLGDGGLTVEQSITNHGTSPAPVAAGAHPYLTVGTDLVDDAVLHVDADSWIDTGAQQIPTGVVAVDGTPYDFRTPRPIGTTEIDYTFTGLHRDDEGRFTLTLRHPSGERSVALWVDQSYDYVEVYTGDTLPDVARRRRGLGVEPMSAPPNALASGTGLTVLDPGATWTGRWGITAGGARISPGPR